MRGLLLGTTVAFALVAGALAARPARAEGPDTSQARWVAAGQRRARLPEPVDGDRRPGRLRRRGHPHRFGAPGRVGRRRRATAANRADHYASKVFDHAAGSATASGQTARA